DTSVILFMTGGVASSVVHRAASRTAVQGRFRASEKGGATPGPSRLHRPSVDECHPTVSENSLPIPTCRRWVRAFLSTPPSQPSARPARRREAADCPL